PPVVLGGMLVVPKGLLMAMTGQAAVSIVPADTQASAARARAIVMDVGRSLGFEPTDREFEKLGYDVESGVPGTGKLRFIEVMRTNDNTAFFQARHLAGQTVIERLEQAGWRRLPRVAGAGPAVEYAHAASRGQIGIIAPYAKDFCASCNRLRMASNGKLHLCLFGDGGIDLRPFLQQDADREALIERIRALTATKAPAHRLHQNDSGATPHLASIGG
ncbi:MAG: hypothetical protein CVT83_04335, partial [Alphaproteobacteria bacterium HGW-Alphaproteobacteria-5]